ncbi:hypothetical protein ABPG72_008699 [Tetrahymena utriculariae]
MIQQSILENNKSIFQNKAKYILIVVHSGLNILQYSICLSLLNTLIGDLPHILGWSSESKSFLTGLVNSSNTAGAAMGSISSGYFSASYGRRNMFIFGDLLCILGSSIGLIQNTYTFILGRFICGVGMGVLVNLVTLFVMEWTHYKYRGYAGAPMVCFTPLGMIISSLVGLGIKDGGQNYWKIIVSFPGILSLIHVFGYIFVIKTDSPFQIFQKHRDSHRALSSLNTIYNCETSEDILNKIVESIEQREQKNVNKKLLTISEMLSIKSYRIRMIVCALCAVSVNFSGYFIISIYTTKIITDSKSNDNNQATLFSIYTNIAELISVAIATIYVEKIGRKFIFLSGILFAMIMLIIIGFLAQYSYGQYIPYMLIFFKFGFGTTISPLYPIIISETIVDIGYIINSLIFWSINTSIVQIYPILIDTQLGFQGIFWLFSGILMICFLSLMILMKETKGLTLKEIHFLYRQTNSSSVQSGYTDSIVYDKQILIDKESGNLESLN